MVKITPAAIERIKSEVENTKDVEQGFYVRLAMGVG